MDVGYIHWWFTASTMAQHTMIFWLHHTPTILQHMGPLPYTGITVTVEVHPYAHPQHKGAQTLYTYPIWIWDAVSSALKPQP
jgi:hypothetical protein